MEQQLRIELEDRSYPILIGTQLFIEMGERLTKLGVSKQSPILLITDQNVFRYHYVETLLKSLRSSGFMVASTEIPAGERSKSLEQAGKLYEVCLSNGLDRKSTILALGGGVVGDLAGFVAATYMRGIDFIGLPTTILAHDSSVGGKVAVNLPQAKNLIGCFYQPKAVFYDVSSLKTLSIRERQSGFAEVIKHAFLDGTDFVTFLEQHAEELLRCDENALMEALGKGLFVKAQIVSMDERENHVRAHLNLGHTLGHAIEAVTGYERYTHGEAISIGMNFAFTLAVRLGVCSKETRERAVQLLQKFGLPTTLENHLSSPELLERMYEDKKTTARELAFVLPQEFGQVSLQKPISPQTVLDLLEQRGEWGS